MWQPEDASTWVTPWSLVLTIRHMISDNPSYPVTTMPHILMRESIAMWPASCCIVHMLFMIVTNYIIFLDILVCSMFALMFIKWTDLTAVVLWGLLGLISWINSLFLFSTGEWILCSSPPTLTDPAVSNIYSFVDLRWGDMNVCLYINFLFYILVH